MNIWFHGAAATLTTTFAIIQEVPKPLNDFLTSVAAVLTKSGDWGSSYKDKLIQREHMTGGDEEPENFQLLKQNDVRKPWKV